MNILKLIQQIKRIITNNASVILAWVGLILLLIALVLAFVQSAN